MYIYIADRALRQTDLSFNQCTQHIFSVLLLDEMTSYSNLVI